MKKVEIELYRYHNILFGKVLHMDESLRGIGKIITSENEDYKICSVDCPDIIEEGLYLQGGKAECDDLTFDCTYTNAELAEKAAEEFKKLIDRINEDTEAENEKVIKII